MPFKGLIYTNLHFLDLANYFSLINQKGLHRNANFPP